MFNATTQSNNTHLADILNLLNTNIIPNNVSANTGANSVNSIVANNGINNTGANSVNNTGANSVNNTGANIDNIFNFTSEAIMSNPLLNQNHPVRIRIRHNNNNINNINGINISPMLPSIIASNAVVGIADEADETDENEDNDINMSNVTGNSANINNVNVNGMSGSNNINGNSNSNSNSNNDDFQILFPGLFSLINNLAETRERYNLTNSNLRSLSQLLNNYMETEIEQPPTFAFGQEDIKAVLADNDVKKLVEKKFKEIKTNTTATISATTTTNNCINTTCNVCLEDFEDDSLVTLLPTCNHYFHTKCIKPWIQANSNKCPVCRITIGKSKYIDNGRQLRL
jgi:hypothetical protein